MPFLASQSTGRRVCIGILFCAIVVGLRVLALGSDPYAHLSWSSALLTDEGFYIHNARNVVLFGHPRTDQFNNMLIMPTLHWVQVAVFRIWGPGAVPARSISVVCGLITLALFYAVLKRVYGERIACLGTVFLGLGHTSLLYSRMALMDTPASLGLTAVFALWITGIGRAKTSVRQSHISFFACGIVLSLTYVTRGLTAWIIPVPFLLFVCRRIAVPQERKRWDKACIALASGFVVCMAVYVVIWYLPNRTELGAMNRYYLLHQVMPRSISGLRSNITHALIGDTRGLSPYLFRHSPVEFILTLISLAAFWPGVTKRSTQQLSVRQRLMGVSNLSGEPDEESAQNKVLLREMGTHYLLCWVAISWLVYSCISYAPDRYYVLFYPALAAISAIAVTSIRDWWVPLRATWRLSPVAMLVGYHSAEAVIHHRYEWILFVAAVVAGLVASPLNVHKVRSATVGAPRFAMCVVIGLWMVINTCWCLDWVRSLSYVRRNADRWLTANLPTGSVLIGDVAPGLSMDGNFQSVSVIPGLCNFDRPIEKYADHPEYIVILDERFQEPYWRSKYPLSLAKGNRIKLYPSIVKFPVGIYMIPKNTDEGHKSSLKFP